MVFEGLIDEVLSQFGVVRQGDELLRATVNLAAFVVHQTLAQSLVSRHLLLRVNGRVDIQSAGVCVLSILGKHHLPNGFSHKLGMQGFFVARCFQSQGLGFGLSGFTGCDVAVFFHALDDVELTLACAFGVDDGVEG